MYTKKELILTLHELDNYKKFVLNSTTDQNSKNNLKRFKKFIDNNKIIQSIFNNKIKCKEPVHLIVQMPHSYFFNIEEPENLEVHMASTYYLLNEICNENEAKISSLGCFLIPGIKSNQIKDKIQHFMVIVFKPLFEYLKKEIEREKILSMDETINSNFTVNQTINGDNNIIAYSGRDSAINKQDLKEAEIDLKSLIEKAVMELTEINLNEEEKEDLLDDLNMLNSEINSDEPKTIRFKKIRKNIDSFISDADETLKKSVTLFTTLTSIVTKINEILI